VGDGSQAPLEDAGAGLAPTGDGWFVVNVRDTEWLTSQNFGSGCVLLVEGGERELKAWDFFHCPPGVEHVFVGAGDGPCVVLMVGARVKDEKLFYPVSELAGRYDASAEADTPDPSVAYARLERPEKARPPYWAEVPWA